MAIRLSKAIRELNIGFHTAVEFLIEHTELGEVEESPNFKLSDAQYTALVAHFKDKRQAHLRPSAVYPKKEQRKDNTTTRQSSSQSSTNTNWRIVQPLEDFNWEEFESSATTSENIIENTNVEHQIVEGKIVSFDRKEVFVNIGYMSDGTIPASEFRYNPDLKVGDTVKVYVESIKGQLILSHKKARLSNSWERLNNALENNETITVFVKSRTKGGSIVDAFGIEAFMPASQTDIVWIDIDTLIGKTIEVKVIKINQEYRNVVVSRKAVIEENLEKKQADKSLLKEIWQKHTEVQELILRQRTEPIPILPDSSNIVNDKLHVVVDTSDNTDTIKQQIIDSLELDESDCHFEEGYIHVPITNWEKLDERTKSRISRAANKEYVSFSFLPVVDGAIVDRRAQFTGVKHLLDKLNIEYDFDKKGRLQISIEELNRLKDHEEFHELQLALPDSASAIIFIYPSILVYLEKFCQGLKIKNITTFKSFKNDKISISGVSIDKQIIVEGGYFKQELLDKITPDIRLTMCKAEFSFRLHDDVIHNYDDIKEKFKLPKLIDNIITFSFRIKQEIDDMSVISENEEATIEERDESDFSFLSQRDITDSKGITDFNFYFHLCNNLIQRLFGKGNYDYSEKYFYKYLDYRSWITPEDFDNFNDLFHRSFKPSIKYSISSDGTQIGIDFNWKEESLPDILTKLSKEYQFVDFNLFKKGHKCNFDIHYKKADMSEIMNLLHDFSDDIITDLRKKGTELYFSREFQKIEDLLSFRSQLTYKLNNIDKSRYKCSLSEIPSGKIKLNYFHDIVSRNEERLAAARELKGADFTIGDLKIGRLIRTGNYPELVFDISGDFYEETKKLFEDTETVTVDNVVPDLSGDLEKLARLKESLNRIMEGRDVENPSLGTFIFDASQAAGIKDYEDSIRLEIQEVEKHLLNKKIKNNYPQKEAIAKAILAPDLALIQGPPGTGKSTAIAELIWQHVRENPDTRILLTSETNLAVDNAIDRVVNSYHNLVKPIRIGDESRLETEGLQFSYSAMSRWANGTDIITPMKSIDDDEDNEQDDIEDVVYTAPDKLILLNWMENIGRRIDKERMPEEAQEIWLDLLSDPTVNLRKLFFDNYIANCNVIGATCSSIGQKNIFLTETLVDPAKKGKFIPTAFYRTYRSVFSKRENVYNPKIRFDVVIQDESSKATPAELSLPLIYGKKNVIIGDHRQLPPMLSRESFTNSFDYLIKKEKNNDNLQRIKELKSFVIKKFDVLEVSHFERLFNQIDNHLKGVFNYQFRMHPAINEVIKQFYKDEGGLECGLVNPVDLGINDPDYINNGASRYHGITAGPISPDVHVLWIDTSTPEMLDGTSRVNYGEVKVIKKLLTDLNNSQSFHEYNNKWTIEEDRQIGLISFYGKQLRLLREVAREFDKNELPIRVSTVDRFQGMERNIIIVSMVRSHCIQTEKGQKPNFDKYGKDGYPKQEELGFAQSPNRLNVALSRAKRLLIIVGDSKLFRTKDIYNNVYNIVANHENGNIITAEDYGL